MKKLLLAVGAACLFGPPAMATPTLSGSYAFMTTRTCQLVVHVDKSGGVKFNDADFSDAVTNHMAGVGTIAFDAATGNAVWSSTIEAVSLVRAKYSDGSKRGTAGEQQGETGNAPFSNTDTTLTFDGITYDIVYSGIDQDGVAHGFMGALKLPFVPYQGCITTLQGQRQ